RNLDIHLKNYKKNSSLKKFLMHILENRKKKKEVMNDIVEEGMFHQHKIIDRFNTVIIVFAATAPLMGLLGTVTGMISTFDILTMYGEEKSKLLSNGISKSLITTQLGLLVAIPILLFGNILSNWGKNIKMTLDKIALRLINGF
ncbi:MAG: MotA/TolQ/ExbB proton channel family protein, partial [Halobacteriovoraceae bacterium]|nr:MotA/TolQ/ExbB proton channel family protein [Halobacteriovoraceae bacterium]